MELDLGDLVGHAAAGDVDGHFIAHNVAEKGAAHRGIDGDGALGKVGFIRAKQGKRGLVVGIHVHNMDGRAKGHTVAAQGVEVDDGVLGKLGLDVVDARFEEALTFTGGVVAGVFAQVTFFTGILDGLDDGGALLL